MRLITATQAFRMPWNQLMFRLGILGWYRIKPTFGDYLLYQKKYDRLQDYTTRKTTR